MRLSGSIFTLHRLYFGQSTLMTLLTRKTGSNEGSNELPRELSTDDPRAQAQNIDVIMFNSLVCGIGIVAKSSPHAFHLISSDTSSHAAATNENCPCNLALLDCLSNRASDIRIIRRLLIVHPEIENIQTSGLEEGFHVLLEEKSRVVRSHGYFHFIPLYSRSGQNRFRS